MKRLIFVLLLSGSFAHSQQTAPLPPSSNVGPMDRERMYQQGKLFTVQLSAKNPIQILIVGRKEAEIDPKTLKVTVMRLSPGPRKQLSVERHGDVFEIKDKQTGPMQLELTTKSKNKEEKFNFKIPPRP